MTRKNPNNSLILVFEHFVSLLFWSWNKFTKVVHTLTFGEMRLSSAVTTCSTLLPWKDQYPIQATLAFAITTLQTESLVLKNLSHLHWLCLRLSGLMRCLYDNAHACQHRHFHHPFTIVTVSALVRCSNNASSYASMMKIVLFFQVLIYKTVRN